MSRVESFLTVLPPCVLLCVVAPLLASVPSEMALIGVALAAVGLAWLIVAIITVAKALSVARYTQDE